MTDQEKMRFINYMQMKSELDNVSYNGVGLKLDGMYADAHLIASTCVFNEDTEYMRDYRRDGQGRISELNFERVQEDEKYKQ